MREGCRNVQCCVVCEHRYYKGPLPQVSIFSKIFWINRGMNAQPVQLWENAALSVHCQRNSLARLRQPWLTSFGFCHHSWLRTEPSRLDGSEPRPIGLG